MKVTVETIPYALTSRGDKIAGSVWADNLHHTSHLKPLAVTLFYLRYACKVL